MIDFETFKIILYIGASVFLLFILIKFVFKPKKCLICSIDTKDEYNDTLNKRIPLCRNHLVDRWKKDVILSPYVMVVIEPDFVNYPYAYLYATLNKLKEWQYTKEDLDNISYIANTVSEKKCTECSNDASVAYFRKEDYKFPYLGKISAQPVYLCKNCVVKKIEPLLRNSSKPFVEGVYAPTNDLGVYHIQIF